MDIFQGLMQLVGATQIGVGSGDLGLMLNLLLVMNIFGLCLRKNGPPKRHIKEKNGKEIHNLKIKE